MSAITRLSAALADRYIVERELGTGGMAVVVLARDVRHQRQVAIKMLRPELSVALGTERFLREIDTAARLSHPHILPLHDSGKADGLLFYVMPYVEGESLRDRLRREPQLPLNDALSIAREVGEALDYAHGCGIVHRDIKPENILLSDGHAVVADFGIAKALNAAGGEKLTETGLSPGTPAYMSPEQVDSRFVDGRSDLYSLGCVVYEMLAGQPPFTGPTGQSILARHAVDPVPSLRTVRPGISGRVEVAIVRALAKVPADRFATALEFSSALALPEPATLNQIQSPRLRRYVAVSVVALAGLVMFAVSRRAASDATPAMDPRLVAIMPFRVEGADSGLHYLGQGMIDLMAAKLTGEGGPRAADTRAVAAALRSVAGTVDADVSEDMARSIAHKVGAQRALRGTVVGSPAHFVITASLVEDGVRLPHQATTEGPNDSLMVMVDRLTVELLAAEAGTAAERRSSLAGTSLEAVRAYLDGQAAYRRADFVSAVRFLERSVQIDTTFALAALELLEAASWGPPTEDNRAEEIAWKYRDRLSGHDRLLLTARLGPDYPRVSPAGATIVVRERLTEMTPESPDAWFDLGDEYFHNGFLVGRPELHWRAEIMFHRALDRDPNFAPALSHLIPLAVERGDTAELGRLVPRLLALASHDWPAWNARWHLAAARRDEPAMAAFIRQFATEEPLIALAFLQLGEMRDSIGLAHMNALIDAVRPRVASSLERARFATASWVIATNLGRPIEARHWSDSVPTSIRRPYRTLGWLYGGDSVGVDAAGRAEERASQSSPADFPSPLFLTEAWKLRKGNVSTVDQTVHRLRFDSVLSDSIWDWNEVLAQVLEGWAAVVRESPGARRAVDAADSMLIGRGGFISMAWLNPLVAQLYGRLGVPDRALAAVRRRYYFASFCQAYGLAETSRFEGLWAAQTGDRAGAVRAYRQYLLFRANPEPSKIPQRDSVRAELARLE